MLFSLLTPSVQNFWLRAAVAASVPVNTSLPTIVGNNYASGYLLSSNGAWTNSPTSYTYQWYADGALIPGATLSLYQVTKANADAGADLTCRVVAINAHGSSSPAESAPTAAARPFVITVNSDNSGATSPGQFRMSDGSAQNLIVWWQNVDTPSDNPGGLQVMTTSAGTITFAGGNTYRVYVYHIGAGSRSIVYVHGGDNGKVTKLNAWGDIQWDDLSIMFLNCYEMTADESTYAPNLTNVTSIGGMFGGAGSGAFGFNPRTDDWDTSGVTEMFGVFSACYWADPDVSLWDTGNVTDMGGMFASAISADPDVSAWDVRNVAYFTEMFTSSSCNPYCGAWQLSPYVGEMFYMFTESAISDSNWSNALLAFYNSCTSNVPLGPYNQDIGAYPAKYNDSPGEPARSALISDFGWVIDDGGPNY